MYDSFLGAFVNAVKALKVGDCNDESVVLGPIQNQKQYDLVKHFLRDSEVNGHLFALGGNEIDKSKGFFVAPAIVDEPPDYSLIVQEEQFGPIVPVQRYHSVEEVIGRANASKVGLGATVFGTNETLLQEVAEGLDSGNVWINSCPAVTPEVQFGGVKESGIGTEFGSLGILAYANIKAISTAI